MEANYDLSYKPSWNNEVEDAVNPKTGKAWTTIEKLLGLAKQGADIYDQVKNPKSAGLDNGGGSPPPEETFLGMPKMVGIGVVVVVGGLVAFGIYKLATKK